jgi:DNA-binding IclR family transcriptional regulator
MIPELARDFGVPQNRLHRVLPELEYEGLVEKRGRGWFPAGS